MEVQNGNKNAQVGIVMVPYPAQGHLNQLLHLSHIITSYAIPVHYVGLPIYNRQAKLRLQGWDQETSRKIHFHDVYTSSPPDPNTNASATGHFSVLTNLREPMFQLIQDLSTKFKRLVIIHDTTMSSMIQDVKLIPNADPYIFSPISAFYTFIDDWENLIQKPFHLDSDIPTCVPSCEQHWFTPEIREFASELNKFQDFQLGILFNSCRLIEARYLGLLQRLPNYANKKFFAVGPLNPVETKGASETQRHECLEWLDKQEVDSVVYVSFGSTTVMNNEQIRELAKGLEDSEQKFIWVLRRADKGDIFMGDGGPQIPDGFEERVKNRGMVIREWAPQLQILGHPSTGGFVSHCGWNSCMESISMGVPIAAWPMQYDQPKNSILVTKVLKIGIMVTEFLHKAELVTSDVIEDVLRRLMTLEEGNEMRKRVGELGEAVRDSVAEDGASRLEMDSFITHITR